jgi:hypothetical protein
MKFFFNLKFSDKLFLDGEGMELRDFGSAHEQAVLAAREIIGLRIKYGCIAPLAIVVTNADREELLTLPLAASQDRS